MARKSLYLFNTTHHGRPNYIVHVGNNVTFPHIFLIHGKLNLQMQSPQIWKAGCNCVLWAMESHKNIKSLSVLASETVSQVAHSQRGTARKVPEWLKFEKHSSHQSINSLARVTSLCLNTWLVRKLTTNLTNLSFLLPTVSSYYYSSSLHFSSVPPSP